MSWMNNIDAKDRQTLQDIGNNVTVGGRHYDTGTIARSLLLLGYGNDMAAALLSISEERLKSAGFNPVELAKYGFFDGTERNGSVKYVFDSTLPSPHYRNINDYAGTTAKELAEKIKAFIDQKRLRADEHKRVDLQPDNMEELSKTLEVPASVVRNSVFVALKQNGGRKPQAYGGEDTVSINLAMLDETIRNHVPHPRKRSWVNGHGKNENGNGFEVV